MGGTNTGLTAPGHLGSVVISSATIRVTAVCGVSYPCTRNKTNLGVAAPWLWRDVHTTNLAILPPTPPPLGSGSGSVRFLSAGKNVFGQNMVNPLYDGDGDGNEDGEGGDDDAEGRQNRNSRRSFKTKKATNTQKRKSAPTPSYCVSQHGFLVVQVQVPRVHRVHRLLCNPCAPALVQPVCTGSCATRVHRLLCNPVCTGSCATPQHTHTHYHTHAHARTTTHTHTITLSHCHTVTLSHYHTITHTTTHTLPPPQHHISLPSVSRVCSVSDGADVCARYDTAGMEKEFQHIQITELSAEKASLHAMLEPLPSTHTRARARPAICIGVLIGGSCPRAECALHTCSNRVTRTRRLGVLCMSPS